MASMREKEIETQWEEPRILLKRLRLRQVECAYLFDAGPGQSVALRRQFLRLNDQRGRPVGVLGCSDGKLHARECLPCADRKLRGVRCDQWRAGVKGDPLPN